MQTDHEAVLATENKGKVVSVAPDGKSVAVEYARDDGTAYRVCYKDLASVKVKAGDTVDAG